MSHVEQLELADRVQAFNIRYYDDQNRIWIDEWPAITKNPQGLVDRSDVSISRCRPLDSSGMGDDRDIMTSTWTEAWRELLAWSEQTWYFSSLFNVRGGNSDTRDSMNIKWPEAWREILAWTAGVILILPSA